MLDLIQAAEAHHALNTGPVVPTAVEDHDFTARRQMGQVALNIHLRLFAVRRCRQCNHTEDTRAYPLSNGFDRTAFACAIASFEDNTDLGAAALDPLLKLHEL